MSRSDEALVNAVKATHGTRRDCRRGQRRGGTKREDQLVRPIQSAEGARVAKGDALGG
jgi:hypothetical protein